jgi:YfiH family protein
MSTAKFDTEFNAKPSAIPSWQHPALNCTTEAGLQIRHGFFTAKGGVSAGIYESLNCGFGSHDDPVLITENRRRVAVSLGFAPDRMFGLCQTHSSDCVFIDEASDSNIAARPTADAMVTGTTNHALAILTADCVPVLFAEPSAGLVGAAHAGWRGSLDGILGTIIAKMIDKGAIPKQIKAVIGPAIQQVNYEVGDDLRSQVLRAHPNALGLFISEKAGKYRFDLPGFVEMCLRAVGLDQIHNLGIDTYDESSGLFSHRQTTHAALPDSGRQISVIGILSKAGG